MVNEVTVKRISRRKKTLCLFLVGNLVPVCYVCWMCFAPPTPLELSAETTFLVAPLTADGQHVDYFRHTRERISKNDYRDDLWKALVSPREEYEESSEWSLSQVPAVTYKDPRHILYPAIPQYHANKRAEQRHTARLNLPYSSESDSVYSATTRENEDWYLAVLQTDPGPVAVRWWSGVTLDKAGISGSMALPTSDVHGELTERFALRASLAFGEGRFDEAVQTLKLIDSVAEREKTLPFRMNQQVANNIVRQNINTAWYGILESNDIPTEILREFDAYGSVQTDWDSWTKGLNQDRLAILETLSEAHRTCGQSEDFDMFGREFGAKGGNWFVQRIDFNSAMRLTDDTWDRAISAFRISDTHQSLVELNQLVADVTKRWPEPSPSEPTLSELVLGDHNGYAHNYAAETWFYAILRKNVAHTQNSRNRLRIAVRLHVFRQRFGKWPESLGELHQLEGWDTPATVLTDSYTGKPTGYRRTDTGFLLWSIGPNCKDECNGKVPENWPNDFESDGDDELWPWPDPRVQWSKDDAPKAKAP